MAWMESRRSERSSVRREREVVRSERAERSSGVGWGDLVREWMRR